MALQKETEILQSINIDECTQMKKGTDRNGQDEEKVHTQYHVKDILLLTSARLRRSLPQKDGKNPLTQHI